jgi:glucosamine-6-phosphate deaminase
MDINNFSTAVDWQWVEDHEVLGERAADMVVDVVRQNPNAVLLLPTGATPEPMYRALVRRYQSGDVSFAHVTTYNLDEYVGLSGDDPGSYRYYMQHVFFQYIDIPPDHVHFPDLGRLMPNEAAAQYEARLRAEPRIDLAVVGVGINGHIGFNEPGDAWEQGTHVVKLSAVTRRRNQAYFVHRPVPEFAVTVGIQTILRAQQILVLVAGADKRAAVSILRQGEIRYDWPVTSVFCHPRVTILAERQLSKDDQSDES